VPDPKSRNLRAQEAKTGSSEAHDTFDPRPHLEVVRPDVKVTVTSQNSFGFAARLTADGAT